MDNMNTLGILRQLERGEINADEADARLSASPSLIERDYAPRVEKADTPEWIRQLWVYPLTLGILIVCLGAWIIASTLHASALWFLLGLPIVLLGSLLIAVAASAQSSHWVYVNIQQAAKHRHNIQFGIPLPMGIVRGALWPARLARRNPKIKFAFNEHTFNAKTDWAEIDEILTTLEHELEAQHGISVDVDDNGERVQVYIV